MRARTRLTVAGLIGMLVALLLAGVAAAPAQAFDEDAIVQLVNEARWADGSAGVNRNAAMDAVALAWAEHMASTGDLSHNPDFSGQIPGGWTNASENIAQGYGSAGSVMDGWMGSSGHRANILGPATDIGVALIDSGGTTWAVQVFAAYPGQTGPQAPAPAAPEQAAPPEAPAAAPVPVETPVATPTPTPTPTATAPSIPATTPAATEATPRPTESDVDGRALALAAEQRQGQASPVASVLLGIAAIAVLVGAGVWFFFTRRRRPS